jgi:DNA-binding response OmpR family regulator
MLPQMDGFAVLKNLRERKDEVPVLMLTARGQETDRVQGLSLGADDYLVKPFSVLELVARVKAILRRTRPVDRPPLLRSGPFRFDLPRLEARRDGRALELTPREFRLLEILITHPGRTHSRRELLQLAWEPDARPSARTVDVHVANLRRKLGEEQGTPWIATVGGEGYRWVTPVEAEQT